MLEVGSVIDGKYKILNEIGHGGMSTVYLAINERANKTWAVKEVRKTSTNNYEVIRAGLLAETNILKRLRHPNLPSIIDVIDSKDTFLIVMDYIEGKDLQKRLRNGPQPWQQVVDWGIQLCDVLDYLHSQNPPIIYRDMKPANIILKPEGNYGRVMLLDFGTAREYKGGALSDTTCLGTRGYAAPEQYGGQGQTDARSDIYTLGATLYHLVTGHMPDEPPHNRMIPIRQWDPKLPEGLEAIILKCTRSNKLERYQSCKELKYALQHVEEQSAAHIKKQRGKVRAFLASGVLTVVFALIALGGYLGMNAYSNAEYQNLLKQANQLAASDPEESSGDYKTAVDYYKECVSLQPNNGEAYNALLELYLAADSGISSAEYLSLDTLVSSNWKGSGADYVEFCYNFGVRLALNFMSSDGTYNADVGRKYCVEYLAVAVDSSRNSQLQEIQITLAKSLYSIANGQASLTGNNQILDTEGYGYADYWADLDAIDCASLPDDLYGFSGADNLTLSIYQTILSEIIKNYASFSSTGISAAQMEQKIADVETGLAQLDVRYPTLSSDSTREMRDGLQADYIDPAIERLNVLKSQNG